MALGAIDNQNALGTMCCVVRRLRVPFNGTQKALKNGHPVENLEKEH
jgi:hypothetical protein